MTNDSKQDVHERTDTDPHGRDHSEGLAGADSRADVDADERFANSREEGVVEKGSYLDGFGDALASMVDSVTDGGETFEPGTAKERAGGEREAASDTDETTEPGSRAD